MTTAMLDAAGRRRVLETCPVFAGLSADESAMLAEMMRVERFRPSETLFNAGDLSDRVYLVAQGQLAVFHPGHSQRRRLLGPGELLGEYGLFAGQARTASVRAEAEAVVLSLDYDRFRAFLLRFPRATLRLLEVAAARLIAAERAGRAEAE